MSDETAPLSAVRVEPVVSHSSDSIGPLILSALGISVDRCRKAIVNFEAGKPVIIEAEYFAEFDSIAGNMRLKEAATIVKLCNRAQHDQAALKQAQTSVCSVLRDWVKGQVTAVECGIMSFEAAFMPHMLLSTGERVIDRIHAQGMLPAPDAGNVVEMRK
jgi:hypothetical protein